MDIISLTDKICEDMKWKYKDVEMDYLRVSIDQIKSKIDYQELIFEIIPVFKRKPSCKDLKSFVWNVVKVKTEQKKMDCEYCENRREIVVPKVHKFVEMSKQEKDDMMRYPIVNHGVHIPCPICSNGEQYRRYKEICSQLCYDDLQIAERFMMIHNPKLK